MIKASEMRRGQVIDYNNTRYTVKDIQHVAKGNWRSYYQVKLKNFVTGQIIDQRMAVDDRIEVVFVQTKDFEYLYKDGQDYILADPETYDQIPVQGDVFGDALQFLKENVRVTCSVIEGKIVNADLPNVVELTVVDTPPVVKGSTATNQNKEALLDTGAKVKVPPFIQIGELIRVDTRTCEYIERAK